jgi:hypothetical protein
VIASGISRLPLTSGHHLEKVVNVGYSAELMLKRR